MKHIIFISYEIYNDLKKKKFIVDYIILFQSVGSFEFSNKLYYYIYLEIN